ncbi:MAG: hypothetical protein JXR37_11300 [Kiritimatiellae bacterium]|nr:hypothetical protein [Kiritimatiellia bacterium]
MKTHLPLVCMVCTLAAAGLTPQWASAAGEFGLEQLFGPDATIWQADPDAFMQRMAAHGFAWTEPNKKDAARAHKAALAFLSMPVHDACAAFEDGTLNEVTVSLYNRGDSGEIEERAFYDLIAFAVAKLRTWTDADPIALKGESLSSYARFMGRQWVYGRHWIRLEWGESRGAEAYGLPYRCEYLRVRLAEIDPERTPARTARPAMPARLDPVSLSRLRSAVKREPNGDVFVDGIPMIDQGQKAYCAVATTERVLRYYGGSVDQHDLAQFALTSASSGTGLHVMLKGFRAAAVMLGCRPETLYEVSRNDRAKLVNDYNRLAKMRRRPMLTAETGTPLATVYRQMDGELLKSVRLQDRAAMGQWHASIVRAVEQGKPPLWSVFGGHMCLIIGYNRQTAELLYSNSFGAGHEKRRVKLEDAWTVTTGLFLIEPAKETP